MTKTSEQLHAEWSEKNNKFKAESYLNHVVNSLSPADKVAVETLAKLDDMSGGNLPKLYQAYMFIKQSN